MKEIVAMPIVLTSGDIAKIIMAAIFGGVVVTISVLIYRFKVKKLDRI